MFGNGAQIEFVAPGGTNHEWHPIEGMALEELARAMRTSEPGKQTAAAE